MSQNKEVYFLDIYKARRARLSQKDNEGGER